VAADEVIAASAGALHGHEVPGVIQRLVTARKLDAVTVAFARRISRATLEALLATPTVTSVVLAEPEPALVACGGPRVGFVTSERFDWTPPATVARQIVFIGAIEHVGVQFVRQAIAVGAREILFVVPGPQVRARSVWRILAERSALAVSRRYFATRRPTHGASGALYRRLEGRYGRAFRRLLGRSFAEPLLARDAFVRDRILTIVGSLGAGGAERQLVHTVTGLRAAGEDDVTIVCSSLGGEASRFHLWRLEGSGVPVEEHGAVFDLRATGFDPEHVARLAALPATFGNATLWLGSEILGWVCELLDRRPEVVHVWLDATNVKVGIAAAIVGVPHVVLSGRSMAPVHFDLIQPYMRPGYRALLRRPEVTLLNNSEAGAADYARWLDVPRERIRVVHNAVEVGRRPGAHEIAAERRRIGVPEEAPLVGTLLRFFEEKGPLLWVEVAAEVARSRPDAWFVMYGEGPLREPARALARELGIGERLRLPGPLREPAAALAGLDVFVLTSRLEGLPNVVLEAQALGVPVVTTDAGGAREAIDPGRTGYAVSPHAPALLGDRISAILGDPEWRAAARRLAPAFVSSRFGLERMVAETREVYGRGHAEREGRP
jgi:glycosyltransferase involved in cell wall biosynthesis/phenylpyruvate tautomerase PptA (4-oxalocrotonate tautomerase family)